MPERPKSFAFVATPLSLQFELPVEVIPNLWLDRAKPDQIDLFRRFIIRQEPPFPQIFYEYDWLPSEAGGYTSSSLAPEEWRYFVVEYEGQSESIHDLERLGLICEKEFRIGWHFAFISNLEAPGRLAKTDPVLHNYWVNLPFENAVTELSLNELDHLGQNVSLYANIKDEFVSIDRAVQLLFDLEAVPTNHELYAMGLFMALEALITHNPGSKGAGDSLSHQVRTKIPLLSRRLDQPLDYTQFGVNVDPQKIWEKLYGFRSALAHGDRPDFGGALSLLKDKTTVLNFTRTAVKTLLRGALREPYLYRDLKAC